MNTNDNRLKAHKLIDHIFQDLLPAHGMAQRPEQIQLSHRMLDAMQDMAEEITALRKDHDELDEYVESIDDDLADMEEYLYDEDDEDEEEEEK